MICLQCFGVYAKGRLNERQMIADPDLGMEISNDTGYDCYLYNIKYLFLTASSAHAVLNIAHVDL